MPTHNRKRRNSGINWDWERAIQGGISGGAFGAKGGPKIAAAGAIIGGVTGGLSGRDTSIDIDPYEEALQHYAGATRKDARMAGDELAARTGASLAARDINNSRMGAGIISANRGKLAASTEGHIAKMRANMYAKIADAERQAEMAQDAETRQGWLNLARQLGIQYIMGDFEGILGEAGAGDQVALASVTENPDLVEPPVSVFDPDAASTGDPFPDLRPVTNPDGTQGEVSLPADWMQGEILNPDTVELPDRLFDPNAASVGDPFPDLRGQPTSPVGPDLVEPSNIPFDPNRASTDDPFADLRDFGPNVTDTWRREKAGATSVPPIKQDPWFGPRRDKLREVLSPEDMDALDEIFPDGELDTILDPGATMTDAPSLEPPDPMTQAEIGPQAPNIKVDLPRPGERQGTPLNQPPDTSPGRRRELEPEVLPLPDTSPGRFRELESEYAPINITPVVPTSDWATPEKMNGLPSYMAFVYEDEQGFNPDDPSYAGITQETYDEWRERYRMYGAPRYVSELANYPKAISLFYQNYIEDAGVPQRFRQNPALEYMYVDFAIHGGHSGARQRLREAQRMLRAESIRNPTDDQLLMAFNRAKRDFYEKQGARSGAFLDRATRVYDRAMQMMKGSS